MNGRDFSVIVQGPIHSSPGRREERDITIRCLASIRQFLPGAEIVLSTWQGENTQGLDFDILVQSDDPGATLFNDFEPNPRGNNLNRQIVSTRAGLAAATRPFGIKFRGDLRFESNAILSAADVIPEPLTRGLFRSRVLISSWFTLDPRRSLLNFVYSDIFQAGRLEDLIKYWSVPLAPEPETTRWLEGRRMWLFPQPLGQYVRIAPEQYLAVGLIATTGRRVHLDFPADLSPGKTLLSERVLAENFAMLDPHELGIGFPERLMRNPGRSLYKVAAFARLVRAYRHWYTRWPAQVGLLVHTYVRLLEHVARRLIDLMHLEKLPPYRFLRDFYRRFFPLP